MTIHKIEPNRGLTDPGSVRPGDVVRLMPGKTGVHGTPLMIAGLRGTAKAPILITSDGNDSVTVSGPMSEEEARLFLNRETKRRQHGGYYPAPGYLGDLAAITLRDCQFVLLDGLYFRECWPTAIYVDDCRFVGVRSCRIEGSTIAIGVNDSDTRHILIEGNHWQQDMSEKHNLWNAIPWVDVHGASNNGGKPVDVDNDKRHLDGDFVRCWDIAGDLTVRDNDVTDAFNGVHVFNRVDQIAPGVDPTSLPFNEFRRASANVLIENNRFTRIRDNVFEPEEHAWNWVIRHNRLLDCYVPFSLELHRAGWFYIYGNMAAAITGPSKDINEPGHHRKGFAMFKTGGLQNNEGPIHVMFNSFAIAGNRRYFRRGALSRLEHRNNAIQFFGENPDFFGRDGSQPGPGADGKIGVDPLGAELLAERNRFTRRWDGSLLEGLDCDSHTLARADLGIAMDGDIINDADFPEIFKSLGYPIGRASLNGSADFPIPDPLPTNAQEVYLTAQSAEVLGNSIPLLLELHNGDTHSIGGGIDRGAHQSTANGVTALKALDAAFGFLPNANWADTIPRAKIPEKRRLEKSQAAV